MKILSKKRQHNYITESATNQEKLFDKERQIMTKLIKKGQRKSPIIHRTLSFHSANLLSADSNR